MASVIMQSIIQWLEDYKIKTNCRGVVLGISGGKDSTTVAMLAKKAWGDNVFGVMMPDGQQGDIQDAINVCCKLHLNCATVNIGKATSDIISEVNSSIRSIDLSQKTITNIAPRMRMIVLYAIAQQMGYRVIGTGNASEAYIGWTTKWGDSAYDLNPIYHLTCSEVVGLGLELAKEFGLDESLIVKPPCDGLTGRSDEDNFGFTYAALDKWIREGLSMESESQDVTKIECLHKTTEHKRRMPYTTHDLL